jgi:hypothetical protein
MSTNMKKYAILLLAGTMITFASCGDGENTSTSEQIDSMATYRTDTMEAALKAQNDSLINEMARMRADSALRADSIAAAAAAKSGSATAKASTKTTKAVIKTTTKTTIQPSGTKVTDRPGATDVKTTNGNDKPKSVSDRPGATNVNR